MNRDLVTHLIKARLHLRDAILSVVPEPQRSRLRRIDQQWRGLIVDCLREDAPPKSGPRRIDIEE